MDAALQAIRESISTNSVVYLTDTENGDARATLLAKCADYVRDDDMGLTEFWGGEGDFEWSVRLLDAEEE
jgi:hypothetical protein